MRSLLRALFCCYVTVNDDDLHSSVNSNSTVLSHNSGFSIAETDFPSINTESKCSLVYDVEMESLAIEEKNSTSLETAPINSKKIRIVHLLSRSISTSLLETVSEMKGIRRRAPMRGIPSQCTIWSSSKVPLPEWDSPIKLSRSTSSPVF